MSAAENNGNRDQAENEVWNAIAAFEQILQAMPEDRLALESLHEAYEKIGDHANALDYLLRLARVVADEKDSTSAPGIIEQLKRADQNDARVKNAISLLEKIAPSHPSEAEAAPTKPHPVRRRHDITAEMSLAWNLLQAAEISQDDYNNIIQDLTENLSKKIEVPVSVLHVIEDRRLKNADRILAFISRDAEIPIIPLSRFEIQEECFDKLPLDFMVHRGALVFEIMQSEALVAILNPYDTNLRNDVREQLGMPCHFYLVSAPDYDAALTQIRTALAERAAEKESAES